jgi:Fe-S cluster assembly protein SufB
LKQELIDKGVIFDDTSIAVNKYPELLKKYFAKFIPIIDHKFAALHYAVWS